MITNERQYKITKSQLSKFAKAIEGFDIDVVSERYNSTLLAKAELDALNSEAEVLSNQIHEYEELKSGVIDILKADCLEELPKILIRARIARGFTQGQLAELINVKEQQIQRYESEEYATASLKRLIEISDSLQLDISEIARLQPDSTTTDSNKAHGIEWGSFPIVEMYRRNWFEGFTGSLQVAKNEAQSLLEKFFKSINQKPVVALHRQRVRSGSNSNKYALLAWECRVLTLAQKSPPKNRFNPKSLDDKWFRSLAQDSQFEDGPIRAQKRLEKAGISLVIEARLPHTHLDGAVFLHNDLAVIGMTLRYDRLDNFWFVLMHELMHLTKHLKKGTIEAIFDDLEASADNLERETDELAGQALIPDEIWETAVARFTQSSSSVISLSEQLKISSAIIAGRIRNESKNYVIFSDMVGNGEVRKQFPDVVFGK